MLCFVQVATLTHGVFIVIPLAALLLAAAIRFHSRPRILVTEPLCLLWPQNQSRHGLAREQVSSVRFVAFVCLLKLVCSASFWASPASIGLLQDFCPDSVPLPNCTRYADKTGNMRCAYINLMLEAPDAKRKQLYARVGDPCWDQCAGCSPEENVSGRWFKRISFRCDPAEDCYLSCCQCLHCHLSPALPNWLKQGCSTQAFAPTVAMELYVYAKEGEVYTPEPVPYYENRTWHSENTMLAQLSRCALTHGKNETIQVQAVVPVVAALQCLPLGALIACILLGMLWPMLRSGSAFDMLGNAQMDLNTLEAIDAKAAQLRDQIAHRRLPSSPKVKFQLWMEMVLFMLDYLSDYNCLLQFFLQGAYAAAAVQVAIIVAPLALDCYRGKIQLVEVLSGFAASRRKGFPTDKFILALRSEKSIEAPLSMFLQYYTLLRTTSASGIWSLCISMPLSILCISKHVYATFELHLLEVLETRQQPRHPNHSELQSTPLGSAQASGPHHSPVPPLSAEGWRRRTSPTTQGSPPAPSPMQAYPARPPGLVHPSRGELLDITVEDQKVNSKE